MTSTSSNSPSVEISNHTLMTFLQKLDDSNKQIMCCMDDLERQNTVNSTPVHLPTVNAWLVTIDDRPTIHTYNQRDHFACEFCSENSCNLEGHRGIYKHSCAYC